MSKQPYTIQANRDEHDHSQVATKRVSIYGWDKDNLNKVRIAVDHTGHLLGADPLDGYLLCFVDGVESITYIGYENKEAEWAIMKIDQSSGIVATYATENNNPSITSITTAREDEDTLTYQLPNQAF